MKERNQKMKNEHHSQKQSSENSMNCTCQIILDTSLSGISNTECSCSDCLEANLNAFNELKEQVQHQELKNATLRRNMSAQHRKIAGSQQKTNFNIDRNGIHRQNRSQNKFHFQDKATINNLKKKNQKPSVGNNTHFKQKESKFFEVQGNSIDPYTKQGFEDYIKITKYRTRKYIQQRKKLQAEQKEQKQKLKQKIKQNLQMLKYTTNMMKENQQNEGNMNQWNPKFVWNHEPYECECNGKKHNKHKKQDCCHFKQKKCPPKPLNTNLQKLIGPEFIENRDQILNNKKRTRIQQIDAKMHQKCSDKCPKHHMRTSPSKIKKIEKFIEKRVKKIEDEKRKKKQKQDQQIKIKEAKLRAIDLKSKDLLSKSKKVDLTASRTSFQLSIDHFSTFSDLREHNQIRIEQKNKQKKINKMMNQKGGTFEKAIYQNLDQDLEGDYFNQEQKIQYQNQKMENEEQDAQFCEKIVKQAKIRAPKNLKGDDKNKKTKNKEKKPQSATLNEKATIRKGMDLEKQQKKKRELQQQIQRKKKELVHEYHKRNTNLQKQDPKNKEIRQDYEKKVHSSKNVKKLNEKIEEQKKNPYRNTYAHQPGKNKDQINIHGDPLLQEFEYHSKIKEKAIYEHGKKEELFTKNYNALAGKQKLYT